MLLSTQRSGTSWLLERIAAHPDVGGYGEVLLRGVEGWSDWPPGARDRPFYTTYLKDRTLTPVQRHTGPLQRHLKLFRYLDYLYEPRRALRAIGFKVMYDQLRRYPELSVYFRWRRVRIVHLLRRNLLDIYLSREALLLRNFAHARSVAERESIQVSVDTTRLVAALVRLERQQFAARRLLGSLRFPTREVVYEDVLADDRILHEILSFLGITNSAEHDLSPVMLKLAPSSHRATIRNFDDVAEVLVKTKFAAFLRDESVGFNGTG